MRLVTFRRDGEARLGAVVDDRVVDLAALAQASGESLPSDMLAFIDAGPSALEQARALLARHADRWPNGTAFPLREVKLLAPIPRPRKNIICLGLNYAEHVAEGNRAMNIQRDLPKEPVYFTKPPTTVVGPDEPIIYDERVSTKMDWEAELAVVIGRRGKAIPKERALEYVFGYTCFNDVSARDLQRARGGQWYLGKSLDTYGPMGPWIVTADEIPDPHNLHIVCRVNGVVKQDSNTRYLIFDIPTCIADYSAGITLEPGDVISTGTPSGVGFARTPPEFMKPGDVVEVEIEKIGVLRNPIVAASR
ncbi:MAG TPA: fumarylacetoacetate hydrolase family protein [Chloroflexota bacterium]|nr:fumarylacetoacetate hydrolase family protein [Chloroflexota bacterium]HZU05467.1 fumarylacetoacetate hydrolase family protein [Chloroflexota bacterium]